MNLLTCLRRQRRNESGFIGGVEGLVFGVLIFVLGTLVVIYGWSVIDAKIAVTAASREAARAYVESAPSSALYEADQASRLTLLGHNRPYIAPPEIEPITFQRCGRVTVTVSTRVHRIGLPLLEQTAGNVTVSASHVEYVDPYRSGVTGAASCPTHPD